MNKKNKKIEENALTEGNEDVEMSVLKEEELQEAAGGACATNLRFSGEEGQSQENNIQLGYGLPVPTQLG